MQETIKPLRLREESLRLAFRPVYVIVEDTVLTSVQLATLIDFTRQAYREGHKPIVDKSATINSGLEKIANMGRYLDHNPINVEVEIVGEEGQITHREEEARGVGLIISDLFLPESLSSLEVDSGGGLKMLVNSMYSKKVDEEISEGSEEKPENLPTLEGLKDRAVIISADPAKALESAKVMTTDEKIGLLKDWMSGLFGGFYRKPIDLDTLQKIIDAHCTQSNFPYWVEGDINEPATLRLNIDEEVDKLDHESVNQQLFAILKGALREQ